MNKFKYLILLIIFGSSLSACNLLPEKPDLPATFDLGPQPALGTVPAVLAATMLMPPVTASAWLDNTGIQYRLRYQNSTRPDAYAQSRWVTPPALLLTDRLRARFAGASRGVVTVLDGAKADYVLRVELEDFSQSFDTAQSSKVNIRLRGSLIDLNTRALQAQKTFTAERPAAPNAPGAAQALAGASDALVEELLAWAAQSLKK